MKRLVSAMLVIIVLVLVPSAPYSQEEGEFETKEKVVIIEYKKVYSEGLEAYKRKKYDEALQHFQKSVELESGFMEGYKGIGLVQSKLKDYPAAIEAYNEALALKPDQSDVYFYLGIAYGKSADRNRANLQKAVSSYSKATELKPDYAAAFKNLAPLYEKQGKDREAIGAYRNAIDLDAKRNRSLNLRLAILLNKVGNYENARAAIVEYLKLKPGSAAARVSYGEILENLKEPEAAAAEYKKALDDGTWGATAKYKLDVMKEAGKISG